jgi:hypothetical protein
MNTQQTKNDLAHMLVTAERLVSRKGDYLAEA